MAVCAFKCFAAWGGTNDDYTGHCAFSDIAPTDLIKPKEKSDMDDHLVAVELESALAKCDTWVSNVDGKVDKKTPLYGRVFPDPRSDGTEFAPLFTDDHWFQAASKGKVRFTRTSILHPAVVSIMTAYNEAKQVGNIYLTQLRFGPEGRSVPLFAPIEPRGMVVNAKGVLQHRYWNPQEAKSRAAPDPVLWDAAVPSLALGEHFAVNISKWYQECFWQVRGKTLSSRTMDLSGSPWAESFVTQFALSHGPSKPPVTQHICKLVLKRQSRHEVMKARRAMLENSILADLEFWEKEWGSHVGEAVTVCPSLTLAGEEKLVSVLANCVATDRDFIAAAITVKPRK
jgi:hypothetical protein